MLWQTLTVPAASTPQGEALVVGGASWTFGALLVRAARVAGWLSDRGVQRGDRVALLLDRSAEAVAAIYGVLLAGAAYVPLDPTAPAPRNAVILRDSGAVTLLTAGRFGRRVAPLLAEVAVEAVLALGPPARRWPAAVPVTGEEALDAAAEPVPGDPEDLAVLLYTSGSTGTPKGVALSHRAVRAFTDWGAETFGLGPGDRVSGVSPLHFDLSTFELFAALGAGATSVIAPAGASAFPATLASFLADQRVSVWYSVPGVLGRLLQADWAGLPDLRAVLFAGEVFPVDALRALMARLPQTRFANLYGPTETNVCTWFEVTEAPSEDLPIGTAASGADLRVVDGELLVAGPSVMHGYFGDPDKTAAAFEVRDGRRWYRTGDRVAWGDDGQLRFFGRVDTMLKVQGFRVQPEEVEAALAGCPGVREVLVRGFVDGDGSKRLEARVVGEVTAEDLRAHAAARLPAYMVPTRVTTVDALPRTDRGKLLR